MGLGLLGVVLFPALAFAAGARVAVLDTIQAPATLKLNARQAVASALDDLGVAMVPLEDLTPEDTACSQPACFLATAKRVGATHLLLVSGVANPAGYRLSLELREGATGRSLGTDGKDCELCAEDQLASALQDRVTKLWKRVAAEDERTKVGAEHGQGTALETQPAVATGPSFWSQRTPVMGLGFAAVGLVGIGFGVYYVAVDGHTVESNRPDGSGMQSHPVILRDTGKWGWTFVAAGAVSFLAGSAMMIWGRDDGSQVSVAVGPASLGLQGRF